jgi:hypothetical protein
MYSTSIAVHENIKSLLKVFISKTISLSPLFTGKLSSLFFITNVDSNFPPFTAALKCIFMSMGRAERYSNSPESIYWYNKMQENLSYNLKESRDPV